MLPSQSWSFTLLFPPKRFLIHPILFWRFHPDANPTEGIIPVYATTVYRTSGRRRFWKEARKTRISLPKRTCATKSARQNGKRKNVSCRTIKKGKRKRKVFLKTLSFPDRRCPPEIQAAGKFPVFLPLKTGANPSGQLSRFVPRFFARAFAWRQGC